MGKFYKRLAFLMALIGVISGVVLYSTVDVGTLRGLRSFQAWSLAAVALMMTVGMYFDGTRLMHLVRISGERITLSAAVQVIFSNYFLALLTPGAAGGAVAQVLFLRHAGVPAGKAAVIVIVRTVMSIFFLLVSMPLVFYGDPALLPWLSPKVLVGGSLLLVAACLGGIGFFQTSLPLRLLRRFTRRIRRTWRHRAFSLYREIRRAVTLLAASPLGMLRVFLESAVSLLALYSIVPILIMGLGASPALLSVMGRMIFLNILLYFAPTPGGAGIAEGGFVFLFAPFAPPGTVGILAVAWRAIAEYLPFTIGLYFTVKAFGREFLSSQMK